MRPWSVEECEAYAKQLRDKSRASTAEHAAQAIDYLLERLELRERLAQPKREWVGLTEQDFSAINQSSLTKLQAATCAESILKEKNA